MTKSIEIPKVTTRRVALIRMALMIGAEAICRGFQAPHHLGPETALRQWMFIACRDEALRYGWPLKEHRVAWKKGDTVAKFLDQFDLQD